MKRLLILLAILITLPLAAPRAQGQFNGSDVVTPGGGGFFQPADLLDHRAEMRQFIQRIARFARSFKRDFVIIVKNADGLFTRVVDQDSQMTAPNTTFLRSLDGVLQSELVYGQEDFGVATDEKDQESLLEALQTTEIANLSVFTLDYVSKPADVDRAARFAMRRDWIPYAAPGKGFANNRLPAWPRRPYNENSHNITNLKQVQNYLYIEDSARFGSREEFALEIHNTNYDMVVINVFHHRLQPFSQQNIQTMQYKKLGSRRLALARMNIGIADTGKFYWQENWGEGSPFYIMEPVPGQADQHVVQFWQQNWQSLFTGDTNSYIYGIIQKGFDGVVIEGVDAHRFFEDPED